MIRKLTWRSRTDQPLFVLLLTGLFVAAGIIAFQNLPIEAFPDVTDIQVTVITLYPGYAAEEVEKQVTTPLEIGLADCRNAVRMFSHTQFGLSFLIITFNDKANDYFARQLVLERLRGVESARQGRRATGAAHHPHRRGLSLSRSKAGGSISRELRIAAGLGGGAPRSSLFPAWPTW